MVSGLTVGLLLCAAPLAVSALSLDAPGHVAVEGAAVSGCGAAPGSTWTVGDWRGRIVCTNLTAGADGTLKVPGLGAGYYHLHCGESAATLAVVEDPRRRVFDGSSFYGVDSAQMLVGTVPKDAHKSV